MVFQENLLAHPAWTDFGVPASANGLGVNVIFDAPDENVLGGRVQSTEYTVTFPTGALGNLIYGTLMTVNGVSYKVRQCHQIEDGQLQKVTLEAVTAVVA